jgi:phage/plasmid-like protein (TIGR03299 family)
MSHRLYQEMYAGKESAWHRLGIVKPELETAVQAIREGGMDFEIMKLPLQAILNDRGDAVRFDMYGLVRGPSMHDDTYQSLGTCGKDYDFFQNIEIADRMDVMREATGWDFSTAGVLGKGETIFICLNMGDGSLNGDDIRSFFTYVETRDGKTVARGFVSQVRTVCQNTLDLGLRKASSKIALRHYAEYKQDADWVMDVIAQAKQSGASVDEALSKLASVQVTDELFHEMLEETVPMPSMPRIMSMPNLTGRMKDKRDRAEYIYEQKVSGAVRTREAINGIYQAAADIPEATRGTGWHAYNAVTHYTTHIHGTLGERGRKATEQSRAEWDLFNGGQVMRDSAYNVLVGLFDE